LHSLKIVEQEKEKGCLTKKMDKEEGEEDKEDEKDDKEKRMRRRGRLILTNK
jgi:hypothetical protein